MTATAVGAYATATALKARLGISDTTDDTVLTSLCDQVNQYIETKTGRVIAPLTSATYLIDVDEETECLHFPRGIRTVSSMTVKRYTGDPSPITLAATDYFLRPSTQDRRPGWPAMWIELSDRGQLYEFPEGFDIVSMTATTGWDAIPDDITDVALTAATRAWHGVQDGQQDIVGTDEMGRPLVSRFFSARDLETLRTYSVDIP